VLIDLKIEVGFGQVANQSTLLVMNDNGKVNQTSVYRKLGSCGGGWFRVGRIGLLRNRMSAGHKTDRRQEVQSTTSGDHALLDQLFGDGFRSSFPGGEL
jgi:hypothetical protein